jgi:hypothetical protein
VPPRDPLGSEESGLGSSGVDHGVFTRDTHPCTACQPAKHALMTRHASLRETVRYILFRQLCSAQLTLPGHSATMLDANL